MKFKHWKEAENRSSEFKLKIESINGEIETMESEARDENIDVEKRGVIIETLQAKVESRNELQRAYDDAITAYDELKAEEERQIGLLNNVCTNRIKERVEIRDERDKRADIVETRQYELAYAHYIRSGDDLEVRNLINSQDRPNAGIFVPKTLVARIEDELMSGGMIMSLCDNVSVKGITEYPVVDSKTDPEQHNELGGLEKTQKEIAFSSVDMEAQFIAETLTTTKKFETDSLEVFWEWLMRELPDAVKRVVDRHILFGGQGSNDGIHGILTNTNDRFVATLAVHVLNFNTANVARAMLSDTASNVTFLMHPSTFFNSYMGLTGADGHPIFQIMTQNIGQPVYSMGGYNVLTTDKLPAYEAAAPGQAYMVAGDFRAMLLNFPDGMSPKITRDPYTQMKKNLIDYLSEIYVGGNITRLGCFVKLTKGPLA